jgi:hypothetical protein
MSCRRSHPSMCDSRCCGEAENGASLDAIRTESSRSPRTLPSIGSLYQRASQTGLRGGTPPPGGDLSLTSSDRRRSPPAVCSVPDSQTARLDQRHLRAHPKVSRGAGVTPTARGAGSKVLSPASLPAIELAHAHPAVQEIERSIGTSGKVTGQVTEFAGSQGWPSARVSKKCLPCLVAVER